MANEMSYDSITVSPSTPHVGAEIGNVDLTKSLSNREVQEIHDAIIAHGVLFFRNQPIDHDAHERFIRYFGEPHVHVVSDGKPKAMNGTDVPRHPAIRRQYFDENSTHVAGEEWHSDQSLAEIPPMYSVLYQEIVPPNGGGATMFLSAAKAYEALSPGMKAYLDGKTATHDATRAFRSSKKGRDAYPITDHPIVVQHPENGRKVLFVNREFTSHINGVPKEESRHILEFLYQHLERPHWGMRFQWTSHSLAMWDNRAVQHYAVWDYWPHRRLGYRMFVNGTERPRAG